MARLINYHGNCGCGADISIATDVTLADDIATDTPLAGALIVRTTLHTTGAKYGQSALLPDDLIEQAAALAAAVVHQLTADKPPSPDTGATPPTPTETKRGPARPPKTTA